MSRRARLLARVAATLVIATALGGRSVAAQARCSVQNPGRGQPRECSVTLTATLQLAAQASLSLSRSTTDIAGGAVATNAIFKAAGDTGIVVTGPLFHVQSNRGVSVTLVNAPQFTGPGLKPASDVRLGVTPTTNVCTGVGTTPLSVAPLAVQQSAPRVLLQSNGAIAGSTRQLCFRVWWRYASDGPGSYALPLTLTVTAP